jgi:hypothetical protein
MFLNRQLIVLILAAVLTLFSVVSGEAPHLVNYQGRLVDSGGEPVTTTTSVIFTIWNDSISGDALWSESRSITPGANGVFSVLLGSVNPVPDSAFAASETYLGIQVGGDPEISPRQRLASVPYAISTAQWTLSGDVLSTVDLWGLKRAGTSNALVGPDEYTQVNFGAAACTTSGTYAIVGGGYYSSATDYNAIVVGGVGNQATGGSSTIGGGWNNIASGATSVIGGGAKNTAGGNATVGGGTENGATGTWSTVAGGGENTANGYYSVVGGGDSNSTVGYYSAIPGGRENYTAGNYSVAMGRRAHAIDHGTFVWADSTDADFPSTDANQFLIRSGNGVGINLNDPTTDLDVAGQIRIRGGAPGDGKVLTSSADGTATWETPASGSGYWTLSGDAIYTTGTWGIARAGNILVGGYISTHTNLGNGSTTGSLTGIAPTVGGGDYNTAADSFSTVSGGTSNQALSSYSTVGGGGGNTATSGSFATIGGGSSNYASATYAVVGGGHLNWAGGEASVVAGGDRNTAQGDHAFVGGGFRDSLVGNYSVIAGGAQNQAYGSYSAILGGYQNYTDTDTCVVAGGANNAAIGLSSVVGGGTRNSAEGAHSLVAGGFKDTASGEYSSVGGGFGNNAIAYGSTISGGGGNAATGITAWVGGGASNSASGEKASVGGGAWNTSSGIRSTTGGGTNNASSGSVSTIGGGDADTASGQGSTVGGGYRNTASGGASTIGGGSDNIASGEYSTVGGGHDNAASHNDCTVGGGVRDTASGRYSTVPGGYSNTASGFTSMAAGHNAKALHGGTFVWGDSTDAEVSSSAGNQFTVRATGGVRFFTNSSLTTGVTLAAGGGSWATVSDRNVKENIRRVDGEQILRKLSKLDISRWNYETQDPSIVHIGPMAQDFYRLFGVGDNNTTITNVDPDGIALASIKALLARNESLKNETNALQKQICEQKNQLDQLRQRVTELDNLQNELGELKAQLTQLIRKSNNTTDSQFGMK